MFYILHVKSEEKYTHVSYINLKNATASGETPALKCVAPSLTRYVMDRLLCLKG